MKPSYTSMLVCPLCKGALRLHRLSSGMQELWCSYDGLAFPIIDELPIMLEHKARMLSTEEKLRKSRKS